jgi:hypothetical protein
MSWERTPPCFDTWEQWRAWQEAARACPPAQRDGYCSDCTPAYQKQMREAGRCMYPYTRFRLIVEGDGLDIQGVRYAAEH